MPAPLLGAILALFAAIPARAEAASACGTLAAAVDAAPSGPIFLASYPGTTIRELQGAAFLYDNAAAAIALIGCGGAEKARRIGDAMLAAQTHDRFWHDGRLRNAYLAGQVTAPVKLAGWWDVGQGGWVEDRYQAGSDTGNMAWAVLALLQLDHATGDHRYRDGGVRLGAFLEHWRDGRGAGGFTGGAFGHEPAPQVLRWKSTEHNTDLAAAFRMLAVATGGARWRGDEQAAEAMVRASWLPDCACFAAGTGEDGVAPNLLVALDAQIWPLLALSGTSPYGVVLTTLRKRLSQSGGYAYSAARNGLWTEGTAQAALLFGLMGSGDEAAALRRRITTMRAPDGNYYAADRRAAATGFMLDADPTRPRAYFHIPHLAATAWVALAERRFNPFTGASSMPTPAPRAP